MTLDTQILLKDIQIYIASLTVIETGNTSIIMVDNKLVYSTTGNITDELTQSYLYGLQQGLLCGVKYIKSLN